MDITEADRRLLELNGIDINEPKTEDILLEIAADHEFRLCEIELFGGIE